ncbi:hypothetical protein C8Q80DRAFT_1356970 [Daedaleopsis nitida]|nr:hypothetical protein C8Q80DRAFT_1356970 [Daedaleopsis nitida]
MSGAAAADARAIITDKIEEHKRAVILLKRRLNTFTDVARLPAELLSEVFLQVCREEYDKQQGSYYHNPGDSRWISVAHTCHSWRELALHTAGLWSYIIITRKTHVESFLARSQDAPLSVTANLNTPQSDEKIEAIEDIFVVHTPRLKEVSLFQASSHTIHGLCQKLCTTAPLLQSLILSERIGQYWARDAPYIFPYLSPEMIPSLRTLNINLVKFRWDQPIFCATLTKLIVRGRIEAPQNTMGSFESLLTAIQNMTTLQLLELNEAIPRLPADTTSVPPPSRKITLPHLRHLVIVSSCRDCANLLAHLSFPENTFYQLSGMDGKCGRDLVKIFKDCLARSEPLHTIRLDRALGTVGHQIFSGLRATSRPHNPFSSVPSEDIYLKVPANPPFTRPLFRGTNLFKNVRRLEVDHNDQPWSWSEIFTGVPNVTFLSITGDQTKVLTDALSTPYPSSSGKKKSTSTTLLLPRLEVVKFSDIRLLSLDGDLTPKFLDLLIDCLMTRCNYNMAVAELRLVQCMNTLSKDVDRLKEIVANVVWDGVEDMETEEEEEDEYDEDEYDEFGYYDEGEYDDGLGFWY